VSLAKWVKDSSFTEVERDVVVFFLRLKSKKGFKNQQEISKSFARIKQTDRLLEIQTRT